MDGFHDVRLRVPLGVDAPSHGCLWVKENGLANKGTDKEIDNKILMERKNECILTTCEVFLHVHMSWMHACVFSCSLILNKNEIIHVKLQLTAYNVQCTQRDVVVDVEGPSVGLGLQLFNQCFGLSCEDLHEIFQNLEVECGRQHPPVRVPLDACGRARRKGFTARLEATVAYKAHGFRSEALCTFSFYLRT